MEMAPSKSVRQWVDRFYGQPDMYSHRRSPLECAGRNHTRPQFRIEIFHHPFLICSMPRYIRVQISRE